MSKALHYEINLEESAQVTSNRYFNSLKAFANFIWLRLGDVFTKVLLPISLLLFFVFVLTPAALVFRLIGFDPLRLKRNPNALTHWRSRKLNDDLGAQMRRQF